MANDSCGFARLASYGPDLYESGKLVARLGDKILMCDQLENRAGIQADDSV
jgi:hypothetical protein